MNASFYYCGPSNMMATLIGITVSIVFITQAGEERERKIGI